MTSFFLKKKTLHKKKAKSTKQNQEVAHICYPSTQAEAGRLLPSVSPALSIQRDPGQPGVPSIGSIGRDKQ